MGAITTIRDILERCETAWSVEEQEELAAYARDIEARRTGFYEMTDEEEAAILKAEEQEARGEIATEEELAEDRRRYGL
jgi:hypothetical protein